jgi:hypothetical protein
VFHGSRRKRMSKMPRESVTLINFDSREFRDICLKPRETVIRRVRVDVASIIYTSGWLAYRRVELTNRNFCSDVKAIIETIVTQAQSPFNTPIASPIHSCTFLVPVFLGSITFPSSLKGLNLCQQSKIWMYYSHQCLSYLN